MARHSVRVGAGQDQITPVLGGGERRDEDTLRIMAPERQVVLLPQRRMGYVARGGCEPLVYFVVKLAAAAES